MARYWRTTSLSTAMPDRQPCFTPAELEAVQKRSRWKRWVAAPERIHPAHLRFGAPAVEPRWQRSSGPAISAAYQPWPRRAGSPAFT